MHLVNKSIMLAVVIFTIASVSASAEDSRIFKLYLEYNGSVVKASGFDIASGYPYVDPSPVPDAFVATVIGTNGSRLYSTNFSMSLFRFDDNEILNKTDYVLRLPFHPDANTILVYYKNKQVLSVDVYPFINAEPEKPVPEPKGPEGDDNNSSLYIFPAIIAIVMIMLIFWLTIRKNQTKIK